MVTNCLKMIGKKVDDPENQSLVNVQFQRFACRRCRCMVLKAEERSMKRIRTNEPGFSYPLCKKVSVATSVLLLFL